MIQIDVIKMGYRQDKEGFVLVLRLNPADDINEITMAALGSQFQMTLVPLDEHGNARLRDSQDAAVPPSAAGEAELQPSAWDDSASPSNAGEGTPPAREAATNTDPVAASRSPRKPVAPEKRLAQQAGICCADPVFWIFIDEADEIGATEYVRSYCRVDSRSKIIPGTPAGDRWEKLHGRFLGWRDHDMPAHGAAE